MDSMVFEKLDQLANSLMGRRKAHLEREIGSVYDHGRRVATGVISLRKRVMPDDRTHDHILKIAAMFHDVGKGIEPHARYGAALFREAVQGLIEPQIIEQAAGLIAAHCDRHPEDDRHDVWQKLLQDADLLDHFGAYKVWMDINYYAYRGEGMASLVDYYRNHHPADIAQNRALLNFPVSVDIYDEKSRWNDQWIERFLVESTGLYVGDAGEA